MEGGAALDRLVERDQGLGPAFDRLHGHAPGAQLLAEDQAVDLVVVDHEHAVVRGAPCWSHSGRRGRRCPASSRTENQKRLPLPWVLSTPISPPMALTSCLQMASPRPVPPKRRVVEEFGLGELLEQRGHDIRGNADAGIRHLEAQMDLAVDRCPG